MCKNDVIIMIRTDPIIGPTGRADLKLNIAW